MLRIPGQSVVVFGRETARAVAVVTLGAATAIAMGACGSGDDNSSSVPTPVADAGGAADSAAEATTSDAGDAGSPDGADGADGAIADDGGNSGPAADATLPDAGDSGAAPDATLLDSGNGGLDGGPSDATVDAQEDAPAPTLDSSNEAATDGSDAAATTLLVPGSGLTVGGMLTSGYVTYYDSNTQSYLAAPLDGGAPTLIYAAPPSFGSGYDGVFGNVAYAWAWDPSTYVGTLTTWTPGQDAGVTLTQDGLAYLYQTFWASDDSSHIAYLVTTDYDSSLGALYGANADGTNPTVLLPSIDINSYTDATKCFPRAVFRGKYLVVSYCLVGGGSATTTVESFDVSNGWAPAATFSNFTEPRLIDFLDRAPFTFPFAVDPDGGAMAVATTASDDGGVQVLPLAGDAGSVSVDPSVALTGNLSFTGSVTNPWAILYNDSSGALHKASAANPEPQVLVETGANYFNALSGDGQWMLVSNATSNLGWFSDLSLVSLQNPGVSTLVASSSQFESLPVAAGVYVYGGPRGFTADSAYALAVTDLVQTSNYLIPWIGYLRGMSVTSSSATTLLSRGYVTNYTALSGSKVLVSDNLQGDLQAVSGVVDLEVVDPALGTVVTIASAVAGDNAISADKKTIVYSANLGAGPGIYVSPLP
jgi:hypothetical protein